ncbi:unnamed protein product [Closterium sp. NIES-53]
MPDEAANREEERVVGQESVGQEARLLEHVTRSTPANDPQAVINAIDSYAWSCPEFFMNVGDVKGAILDDAVRRANPLSAIELGAFCGYSAVRIASQLSLPGARLVSVELSESRSSVVRGMVAHAGLSDKVTVVTGTLQTSTDKIRQAASKIPFDLVFIDHVKHLYLPDLLFLKDQKLIGPGTVIVADNVVYPGSPDYLEFMERSSEFVTEKRETMLEYSTKVKDLYGNSPHAPCVAPLEGVQRAAYVGLICALTELTSVLQMHPPAGLAPAPIPALVASPAPPAPSPAAVAAAGTDAWSRGPAAGEATGPVLGTIAATAATGTAGATAGTGAPDPAATSMTLAAPPSTPFPSPASPSSASPSLAAAAGTPVLAAAPLLPPQPAPAKPSSSSLLTSFSPSTTFCFPAPSISPIFPLPFPMSCFPGPTISSASASPRFVSSTRFAHFTSSCISPITLASLFRTAVCLLGCRVDGAFHAFHRHQPTLPSRRDAAAAVAAAAAVTAAAATCTARGGQLVTRGTAQGAGYLVRAGQHGFRQRSSRDDEAEGAFVAGEDNTLRLRRQAR